MIWLLEFMADNLHETISGIDFNHFGIRSNEVLIQQIDSALGEIYAFGDLRDLSA